ncbi:MAG: hypothetical protein U5K31_01325 [Balneolaceae bacterium]|nr:hypothetical protein [Balneolaceae bacterium]
MQTVLSITLLVAAVGFMAWTFGGKKLYEKVTGTQEKENCGPDCKCG